MPKGVYKHKKGGNAGSFKEGVIYPHSFKKGHKFLKGGEVGWFKKGEHLGKNHWNWKDGATPENQKIRMSIEYRLWREAVFARDNWTCQKCGKKGVKLHAHHILNFAEYVELRFAIDNGITLCRSCHILFHKTYKRKDNNLEQIVKFITKDNE